MTRNKVPLKQVPLEAGVQTGLNYPLYFEEIESCIAAGLNPYEWMFTSKYPTRFKNQIIAWARTKRRIEGHVNDAQNKDMKRKNKK